MGTTWSRSSRSWGVGGGTHPFPGRPGRRLNARILIGLGGDLFTLDIADGGLVVTRGEPAGCDAAVRTDPATFQALLIDRSPASEFAEQVDITGDTAAVHLLFDALGLSAFPAGTGPPSCAGVRLRRL